MTSCGPVVAAARGRGAVVRQAAVYIVANKRNGTLYTGVTSNLARRIYEHREGLLLGFTSTHGCKTLVWYEFYDDMRSAIAREKQIKAGSRRRKLALIEALNPNRRDLYEDLI
jgi:predicted GIY-YIG superfamily endonuclease